MKIQTLKLYCAVLFHWIIEVLFHHIVDKSFQQHSLDGVFQAYGTSLPNDLFCMWIWEFMHSMWAVMCDHVYQGEVRSMICNMGDVIWGIGGRNLPTLLLRNSWTSLNHQLLICHTQICHVSICKKHKFHVEYIKT